MILPRALIVTVLLSTGFAIAAEDSPLRVEVNGLLGEKAVLVIDGERRILATGDVSPEGVELIAVEPEGVRLNIGGETGYFPLGSTQVSGRYTRPEKLEERIYRDRNGMFRTPGAINGIPVDFLVDTGATAVALGTAHAKRLGIDYAREGRPMRVQTASGTVRAWHVKLDRVAVGQIKLTNVDAAVLEANSQLDILLGMSFLSRLDVQHKGEVMVLQAQF